MNPRTERLAFSGAAGRVQVLRDQPEAASRGVAVIAHPHPLFGGTMDNKVVQTLARAFVQCGWTAVRFNFRGVGSTDGVFDEGRGEAEDLQAVVREYAAGGPIALAGFSFGAFVTAQAVQALWSERDVRALVLVGTAASRFQVPPLPAESHDRALVLHGEQDETVPLAAVFDWARPQSLPVTVVPGGEHFFHGQLPLLKNLVVRHLRALG
jgi:alpha/beta superfamily hydrolase